MVVSVTSDKVIFELPLVDFQPLNAEAIETEVRAELDKMAAVRRYARGEIADGELMALVGPEVALDMIEAKRIAQESVLRAFRDHSTRS